MTEQRSPLGLRLFRGIEAGLLSQAAVLAVNFVATPILVRRLGTAGYGFFTLLWTVLNYLYLSSLGTSLATQKFVSHYQALGEPGRLSRLLRVVLAFTAAIGFAAAALLWSGRGWIFGRLLGSGAAPDLEASSVLGWVAVAAPAFFLTYFFNDVLAGLQRFRAVYASGAVHLAGPAVVAAVVLSRGGSLREAVAGYAALQWALALVLLWAVRGSLLAEPSADRGLRGDLREYARFSAGNCASQLLWVLTFQGDRLFIARMLSLADLGFYSVAASLSQKFNALGAAITQPAFPLLSELHSTGQEERLRRFYLRASQLFLHVLLPLTLTAFVLTPQFLTLWLGPDFSLRATWPTRLLLLGNLAFVVCGCVNTLAAGRGHPHLSGLLQGARTVLLAVLWSLLIPRFGIMGAASAFALAQWLAAPFFVAYVHRRLLSLSLGEYLRESCLGPLLASGTLAALGLATHGRIASWASLLAYGAGGTALYYAAAYRLLDRDAKELLRGWVRSKLYRERAARTASA